MPQAEKNKSQCVERMKSIISETEYFIFFN